MHLPLFSHSLGEQVLSIFPLYFPFLANCLPLRLLSRSHGGISAHRRTHVSLPLHFSPVWELESPWQTALQLSSLSTQENPHYNPKPKAKDRRKEFPWLIVWERVKFFWTLWPQAKQYKFVGFCETKYFTGINRQSFGILCRSSALELTIFLGSDRKIYSESSAAHTFSPSSCDRRW